MNNRELGRWQEHKHIGDYGWGIILCVIILCCIGMWAVYYACLHDLKVIDPVRTTMMQCLWYLVGALIATTMLHLSEKQLMQWAPIGYSIGMLLLILLLVLYSREYYVQTGAKSWFAIGTLTFQPVEVMKPLYILMMGRLIVQDQQWGPHNNFNADWRLTRRLVIYTFPIIVALKIINDFGTTLVFLTIFIGMLIVSPCRFSFLWRVLLVAGSIGVVLILLATSSTDQSLLSHIGFKLYQFDRINTWLNPSNGVSDQSYQLWQSMRAVGVGGLTGNGVTHNAVYVPVRESDMIFSVVGETTGFIGCSVLLIVYMYLFYLIFRSAFASRRRFYVYVSTGVAVMLAFHMFENIGMTIGLLPLTGIPLPFVSQGGSAIIGDFMGVGLVLATQYPNVRSIFSVPRIFH